MAGMRPIIVPLLALVMVTTSCSSNRSNDSSRGVIDQTEVGLMVDPPQTPANASKRQGQLTEGQSESFVQIPKSTGTTCPSLSSDENGEPRLVAGVQPVSPVSSRSIPFVDGAHEWRFPNGIRVLFAPAGGVVRIAAASRGGWSLQRPEDRDVANEIAARTVEQSGVGQFSREEVIGYREGSSVDLRPIIGESFEGFEGSANSNDIELMFQLMYLYVVAPRVDQDVFDSVVGRFRAISTSKPINRQTEYLKARYGEKYHWWDTGISVETLDALEPSHLLQLYENQFSGIDDMTFIVVGDINVDTVARLACAYVGTLPTEVSENYNNIRPTAPNEVVRRQITVASDHPTTFVEYIYEAPFDNDVYGIMLLEVFDRIFHQRMKNIEALNNKYHIYHETDADSFPEPSVQIRVMVSGNSSDPIDQGILGELESILSDALDVIYYRGISVEEFEQARSDVMEDERYRRDDYDYIDSVLSWYALFGEGNLPTKENMVQALKQLELSDVDGLANTILDPDRRIEIVFVRP